MPAEPLPTTLLPDRLPDWWRPLGLDLDGDRLDLRRQGITALRGELSNAVVVDAVAYAHGDEAAGARIIDTVRAAARTADGAFAGDVSDVEPPAVVAAALADQLATHPSSELSTVISLLVLSATYSGHVLAIEGMRLPDYAARQLQHASASTRRVAPPARPLAAKIVRDALGALEALPQTGQPVSDTTISTALAGHASILVRLASRIDQLATRSAKEHEILREQLRQQTWVLESWCQTADKPWAEVPAEARPIVAAAELVERTWGSAPAIDVENLLASLLTSAGGAGKTVPLTGVAAAAPLINKHLTAAPNAMLFPVATTLSHWREREGAASWKTAAKGLLPTGQQSEVELSLQAYREALALRVLEDE